jgi:4a-hydroxytetrahydrobiopterin dehydratase
MAEQDKTASAQQAATSQQKTSAQASTQASTQTSTRKKDATYDEAQIQERLKDLPGWYYEDGWIRRQYKTDGWPTTLMLVNTIGYLAEAAYHHPDLSVTWGKVWVKLKNHAAGGVTDKDFELARKIEDVVLWQPGTQPDSSLEGTPDDPRFKYIKYD